MPIEIKELIIRASVREESPERPPKAAAGADGSAEERLVNRCVEQVLDILKNKNER